MPSRCYDRAFLRALEPVLSAQFQPSGVIFLNGWKSLTQLGTQQPTHASSDSTGVENNRKTAEEASLDSITQILAELETFFSRGCPKFLNAMRVLRDLLAAGFI